MASDAKGAAQITKFLGLAFAGADMVVETDRTGQITMALGAVAHMTGLDHNEIMKRRLTSLVTPADGGFVATLINDLKLGERRGPFTVVMSGNGDTPRRSATLAAFRLPQNAERICCAISIATHADKFARDSHGMIP
jgi:PAS domain-containing protein